MFGVTFTLLLEKSLTHAERGGGLSHLHVVDRMDCALYELTKDTKLGGVGGQSYHLEGTQQGGGKIIKNFMKSKTNRCKALNVGWTSPVNPCREGTD